MLPCLSSFSSGGTVLRSKETAMNGSLRSKRHVKHQRWDWTPAPSLSLCQSGSLRTDTKLTFQRTFKPLYLSLACSRSKGNAESISLIICSGVGSFDVRSGRGAAVVECSLVGIEGADRIGGRFETYFRYNAAPPLIRAVVPSPSKAQVYQDIGLFKHSLRDRCPRFRVPPLAL